MSGRNGTALESRANATNGGPISDPPFPRSQNTDSLGQHGVETGSALTERALAGEAELSELAALRRAVAEQPEVIELRRALLSPKEREAEAQLAEYGRDQDRKARRRRIDAD